MSLATTDRDAVLKLEADCCIYMPRATGSGQTRAGLTEDELVEDVVALLAIGHEHRHHVHRPASRGACG